MKSTVKRLFETTDANSQDMFFAYRPFMVSAGWVVASATTSPLKMEFTRQVVDFGEFLKAAPESNWNGALGNMTVTCATLAAAVMTFMF